MKRSGVGLDEIADMHNLAAAFHAAARGKRGRGDVEAFRSNLDRELEGLRTDLLAETFSPGPMRRFRIHDPKPRLIHAPCFRDRVVHHAIIAHVGPILDRALVCDTYACRRGKGTLAAVKRASAHAARCEWFVQIDVRAYFAHIDHAELLCLLGRKFKNRGLLRLLVKIIESHEDSPGRGLPIGTLTSQHFANFYLAGVDRCLLESCHVRGFVRYMDDLVWWTDGRAAARAALKVATTHLTERLHLEIKQVRQGRSADGLSFCGFRILPNRLLLSRRRRVRYRLLRRRAERRWLNGFLDAGWGFLDAAGLQAAFASALALTLHADATSWRRQELARRPLDPALAGL